MTPGFPYPLETAFIDGCRWRIIKPFAYVTNAMEIIAVPCGFKTDFASIPRLFWRVIGHPAGPYAPAAVIHDWLYTYHDRPRAEADAIFLQAAAHCPGVGPLKRRIMYYAIRLFGRFSYVK